MMDTQVRKLSLLRVEGLMRRVNEKEIAFELILT